MYQSSKRPLKANPICDNNNNGEPEAKRMKYDAQLKPLNLNVDCWMHVFQYLKDRPNCLVKLTKLNKETREAACLTFKSTYADRPVFVKNGRYRLFCSTAWPDSDDSDDSDIDSDKEVEEWTGDESGGDDSSDEWQSNRLDDTEAETEEDESETEEHDHQTRSKMPKFKIRPTKCKPFIRRFAHTFTAVELLHREAGKPMVWKQFFNNGTLYDCLTHISFEKFPECVLLQMQLPFRNVTHVTIVNCKFGDRAKYDHALSDIFPNMQSLTWYEDMPPKEAMKRHPIILFYPNMTELCISAFSSFISIPKCFELIRSNPQIRSLTLRRLLRLKHLRSVAERCLQLEHLNIYFEEACAMIEPIHFKNVKSATFSYCETAVNAQSLSFQFDCLESLTIRQTEHVKRLKEFLARHLSLVELHIVDHHTCWVEKIPTNLPKLAKITITQIEAISDTGRISKFYYFKDSERFFIGDAIKQLGCCCALKMITFIYEFEDDSEKVLKAIENTDWAVENDDGVSITITRK